MNRRKRRFVSKIQRLPERIRDKLNQLLRDGALTQQQIRDDVNAIIRDAGLSEDSEISQSGLSRYAVRMEEIGKKIREAREVSEVWTAKLGTTPTTEVSRLLQEVVRTLAFDVGTSMSESGEPVEPRALGELALAIQRIEQSSLLSHKREKEIRQVFAEEAAKEAEEEAKAQGVNESAIAKIRQKIMGLA